MMLIYQQQKHVIEFFIQVFFLQNVLKIAYVARQSENFDTNSNFFSNFLHKPNNQSLTHTTDG